MNIDGYHFQYVSDIEPARDADGLLLTMMPQSRYQNRRGLGLNSYGAGPFCKFRISSRYELSGVYLVTSNDEIRYVGECTNLSSRFNNGYGNISPKNCFKGGQETNCRLNNLVYQAATSGQRVRSGFFRPQITSTWKLPFEPASEFRGINIEARISGGRIRPCDRPQFLTSRHQMLYALMSCALLSPWTTMYPQRWRVCVRRDTPSSKSSSTRPSGAGYET